MYNLERLGHCCSNQPPVNGQLFEYPAQISLHAIPTSKPEVKQVIFARMHDVCSNGRYSTHVLGCIQAGTRYQYSFHGHTNCLKRLVKCIDGWKQMEYLKIPISFLGGK